jgi:hypothetical protein
MHSNENLFRKLRSKKTLCEVMTNAFINKRKDI